MCQYRPVQVAKIQKFCRYFRRLQKRYIDDLGLPSVREESSANGNEGSSPVAPLPDAKSKDDDTIKVPVYCINLLRCNMQVWVELKTVLSIALTKQAFLRNKCLLPFLVLFVHLFCTAAFGLQQ